MRNRVALLAVILTCLKTLLDIDQVGGQVPVGQKFICGSPEELDTGLIVEGYKFTRGAWPWMVALMFKRDEEPLKFFCGGTLVSPNKVVTG